MPTRRLPVAMAKALGSDRLHPGRHAGRTATPSDPLGAPSPHLNAHAAEAWEGFRREIPWLCERDRSLLEVASSIRGRLLAREEVGVSALNLLRLTMGQLGATPTDASRVPASPAVAGADEFFN